MLASLHIENIAVIKKLDTDLKDGFTVFTGETGAGKSIIIDSINLLLGAKPQKDLIRSGETSATVSGFFTDIPENVESALAEIGVYPDEDKSITVQRTVSVDSRSSYRIGTRAVSVSLAREACMLLVNIHGQHDGKMLKEPEHHIDYLDRYTAIEPDLAEYRVVYNELCSARRELERYVTAEREGIRKAELLEYQIKDIEAAKLKSGEEEELLVEKNLLKNSKQVSKQLTTVYRALYKNQKGASASQLIDIARKSLESLTDVIPDAEKYAEKLYDCSAEIERIALEVSEYIKDEGYDPEIRLSEIEDRLDIIHRMKRKYGSSIDEVLDFYERSSQELSDIMSCKDRIAEYTALCDKLYNKALSLALSISEKREKGAEMLSVEIKDVLAFLDMEKVSFSVRLTQKKKPTGEYELTQKGMDYAEFYISTNVGEPQKPLSQIASGGELSRIMLAIKCALAGAEGVKTIIFDEIDTGVSGKTSQKIGIKLKSLAKDVQVLCITHSAQVAANADNHCLIKKSEIDGRVYCSITELSQDERVNEIARIMGGVNITEKTLDTAKEMLTLAKEYK